MDLLIHFNSDIWRGVSGVHSLGGEQGAKGRTVCFVVISSTGRCIFLIFVSLAES